MPDVAPINVDTLPEAPPDTSLQMVPWDQIASDPRFAAMKQPDQLAVMDKYADHVKARAAEAGEDPKAIADRLNQWRTEQSTKIQNPSNWAQTAIDVPVAGAEKGVANIVQGLGQDITGMEAKSSDRALSAVPLKLLEPELENVRGMLKDPQKAYQDFQRDNPAYAKNPKLGKSFNDFSSFSAYLERREGNLEKAIAGQPINTIGSIGTGIENAAHGVKDELQSELNPGVRDFLKNNWIGQQIDMVSQMLPAMFAGPLTLPAFREQMNAQLYDKQLEEMKANPALAGLSPDARDKLARQNAGLTSTVQALLMTKASELFHAGVPVKQIPLKLAKDSASFGLINTAMQGAEDVVNTGSGIEKPTAQEELGRLGQAFVGGLGQGALFGLVGTGVNLATRGAEVQQVKDLHSKVSEAANKVAADSPDTVRDANHAYDILTQNYPEPVKQSLLTYRDNQAQADAHEQTAKELAAADSPQTAAVYQQLAEKARNEPPPAPSELASIFAEKNPPKPEPKVEEPIKEEEPKTFADYAKENDVQGLKAAVAAGEKVPVAAKDMSEHSAFAYGNFDANLEGGKDEGTVAVKPQFTEPAQTRGVASRGEGPPASDVVTLREHTPEFAEKLKAGPELTPEKQSQLIEAQQFLKTLSPVADSQLAGYAGRQVDGDDIASGATLKMIEQLQKRDIPADATEAFARTAFNSVLTDAKRQLGRQAEKMPAGVSLDEETPEGGRLHDVVAEQLAEGPHSQHEFSDATQAVTDFRSTLKTPEDQAAFDQALDDHKLGQFATTGVKADVPTTATDRHRVFQQFRDFARDRFEPTRGTHERPGDTGAGKSEAGKGRSDLRGTETSNRPENVSDVNRGNEPSGERTDTGANEKLQESASARTTPADENEHAGGERDQRAETPSLSGEPGPAGGVEPGNEPAGGHGERGAESDEPVNTPASLRAKLDAGIIDYPEYERRLGGRTPVGAAYAPPAAIRPGIAEAAHPEQVNRLRLDTGRAQDVFNALGEHGADDVRASIERLRPQADRLSNVAIHSIDSGDDRMFYKDGKIFVSDSALGRPNIDQALTHEMAHAVTHGIVSDPRTEADHSIARQLNGIRDKVWGAIPGDIRDAYYQKFRPMFDEYARTGQFDTARLTAEEGKWTQTLYALHSPEETIAQLYSSPEFRGFARGVRYYGDSVFQRLSNWVKDVLGFGGDATALDHFWSTADKVNELARNRPGLPVDSSPLRESPKGWGEIEPGEDQKPPTPKEMVTAGEKALIRQLTKYNTRAGTKATLDAIAEKSKSPLFQATAKFLRTALDRSPDIKVNLEQMNRGKIGQYTYANESIKIARGLTDDQLEHAVLHEVAHALTLGKINAWMLDRIDQLAPHEITAMRDLESLRQKALASAPEEIQALAAANLELRNQLFAALDPKFNKFYGLINLPEFVSESLTNADLQRHLASIRMGEAAKPRNGLQRLWDHIAQLVGGSKDTVLSHALERIGTLTEGRRLMFADSSVDSMQGYRNRVNEEQIKALDAAREKPGGLHMEDMQASGLAKDQLDHLRATRDWRDVKSNPEPSFESQYRPELFDGIKDGKDLLDEIAQAKGIDHTDFEALHSEIDKAFTQGAIKPEQYAEAWNELNSGKLPLLSFLGKKEDRNSLRRGIERWWKNWRPEGNLPKSVDPLTGKEQSYSGAYNAIQKKKSNLDTAAQQVQFAIQDLEKAVRSDYDGAKLQELGQPKIEQLNKILQGQAAPADFPPDTYNALRKMRTNIDELSQIVRDNGYAPEMSKIIGDNLGTWTKRQYQIFNDKRFVDRNITGDMKDRAAVDLTEKFRHDIAQDFGQRAMARYAKINPGSFGTPEHRQAFTDAYNKARPIADGKVQLSSVRRWVDRQLSDFRDIAEGKKAQGPFNAPTAKRDVNFFAKRKDLPESYRELLGEIKDPRQVYAGSIQKLSSFLANSQALRDIHSDGFGTYLFKDITGKYDARISNDGNKAYNPLDGLYTTPEIRAALTNFSGVSSDNSMTMKVFNGMNRIAKTAHTIDSVRSAIRNYYTQGFSTVMNGHLITPDAFKAAVNHLQVQWGGADDAAMRARDQKYRLLGLTEQDPNFKLYREILKGYSRTGEPLDFFDATQGKYQNNLVFKILRTTQHGMEKFYSAADTLGKIIYYEQERAMLAKAYPDREANTPGELDEQAANIVKNSMPTYSRTSPNLKAMRNQPFFGPFGGYFGETVRAMGNSGYYMAKYLKEGAETNNPVLLRAGAQRMAGMVTSLGAMGLATWATAKMVGMSTQDVDNFRKLMPPWEQNAALLFYKREGGKIGYANLNYASPYSYFTDAYVSLARSLKDGDNPITAGMKTTGELLKNFTEPGLIVPKIFGATTNKNDFGQPIVNVNYPGLDQFLGRTGYALDALVGGTPGRIIHKWIPVATGHMTSQSGQASTLPELIGGEFGGADIKEVDLAQRLRASLNDEMDDFHAVERNFTSPFANPGRPMGSDEIRQTYAAMEQARYHAFQDVHQKVEAARQSGVSQAQIHDALSKYPQKEWKPIMAGKYAPYIPTRTLMQLGRTAGKEIPPGLINPKLKPLGR